MSVPTMAPATTAGLGPAGGELPGLLPAGPAPTETVCVGLGDGGTYDAPCEGVEDGDAPKESVCDGEAEAVPEADGVGDCEGVVVGAGDPETDGEAPGDRVCDGELLALAVTDCDAVVEGMSEVLGVDVADAAEGVPL